MDAVTFARPGCEVTHLRSNFSLVIPLTMIYRTFITLRPLFLSCLAELFLQLSEALEVLTDPTARVSY